MDERQNHVGRKVMLLVLPAVLAAESCYCYRAVPVDRVHGLYRLDAAGARKRAARFTIPVNKVFARRCTTSPVAAINNMAVDLALKGRYNEADILFREAMAEDARDPAACNNLGIICEINGDREGAFKMYMEACRRDPGNDIFRNNFVNFADFREGKE